MGVRVGVFGWSCGETEGDEVGVNVRLRGLVDSRARVKGKGGGDVSAHSYPVQTMGMPHP